MRNGKMPAPAVSAALVAVIVSFTATRASQAAEVIFSYVGGTQRTDGGIVAGSTFTAFGNPTFNSLGFVDVDSDGISQSYTVGIWDTATQTLLQSTTVTPSSTLINGFRYAPIPATSIPNGTQFTIGALLPAGPTDPWIDNTLNILGVGFGGAGQGQFVASGTLVFPTTLDDSNYAIVNASDAVVPEPAAGALLAACAAGTLLSRRRRRATR